MPLEDIAHEEPESLRRVIEARIARLSKEEQRVLEVASVAGVVFSAALCAVAADLDADDVEAQCEALARRDHLVGAADWQQLPDGTVSSRYAFVHALYREVCYRRLAPGRRARLHRRVGECLEALFTQRLPAEVPLRHTFLAAPAVVQVLGEA